VRGGRDLLGTVDLVLEVVHAARVAVALLHPARVLALLVAQPCHLCLELLHL